MFYQIGTTSNVTTLYKYNQIIYNKPALSNRLDNRFFRFGQVYDESIEYQIQCGYR